MTRDDPGSTEASSLLQAVGLSCRLGTDDIGSGMLYMLPHSKAC